MQHCRVRWSAACPSESQGHWHTCWWPRWHSGVSCWCFCDRTGTSSSYISPSCGTQSPYTATRTKAVISLHRIKSEILTNKFPIQRRLYCEIIIFCRGSMFVNSKYSCQTIKDYCLVIIVHGNQCLWISRVILTHEFTSSLRNNKAMN